MFLFDKVGILFKCIPNYVNKFSIQPKQDQKQYGYIAVRTAFEENELKHAIIQLVMLLFRSGT